MADLFDQFAAEQDATAAPPPDPTAPPAGPLAAPDAGAELAGTLRGPDGAVSMTSESTGPGPGLRGTLTGPPETAPSDLFASFAEEQDQQRADRVARLGDVMGSLKNPDKQAAVLEVQRKTGAPPELVEGQFDFWKRRAELAGNDPQRFYDENPELAAIALDQPWLGEVVTKDKPLSVVTKALRSYWSLTAPENWTDTAQDLLTGPLLLPLRAAVRASGIDGKDRTIQQPPEKIAVVQGETGKLQGLERVLGKWEYSPSTAPEVNAYGQTVPAGTMGWRQVVPGIYQAEATRSLESITLGQLALRYIGQKSTGGDTYEIEKRALAIRNKPAEEYNAGPVEQVPPDAAQFTGSDLVSLGAAGAGALIGRSAAGAKAGYAVGGALSFGTSFVQEISNLWEFRDQKDDQGRPIDDQVARGSAILYALTAAAVETGVNLGPWAKLVGPLGKDGAKLEAKAFLKEIAKDPAKRVLLARVAEQWARTSLDEGGEEGIQNMLQDAWGWYSRSRSAGRAEGGWFSPQKADPIASLSDAIEVAGQATVGAAVIGLAGGARHYVVTKREIERSVVAERQLSAITGAIKDSPTAKASPEVFTQMVASETAASGERVTAAHIDPAGITRLAQEANVDPAELVREVAGEDGVRRYQEALATGAKLEIPMQEYVEKWGPSGLAEQLLADTTTRANGVLTPRERVAERQRIAEETKRLVDEIGSEKDAPTPAEQLLDGIGRELAAAGKLPKTKVEPQVKLWRKFIRTEAVRNGLEVDDVAKQLVVKIASEAQDVQPVQALAQGARVLTDRLPALTPTTFYVDKNTGLLNRRAFEALPADPARPLVAQISVEGTKWANKAGHTTGNLLYRMAAQALRQVAPDVAKISGDFLVRVKDQAELDGLLARANAAAAVQGFTLTGAVGATAAEAGAAHVAAKAQAEAAGTRALRGARPLAVQAETAAGIPFSTAEAAPAELPAALQTSFEQLSPEQAFNAAFIEPGSGLLTSEAFFALPGKAHVASIDLNGLRAINDQHGNAIGDLILSEFSKVAAQLGGEAFDFAHLSGDEFAAQSDDPAALQAFIDELGAVCDSVAQKAPDGSTVGITFGYGIGPTYDQADGAVEANKQRGVAAERADRARRAEDRRGRGAPAGRAGVAGGAPRQGKAGDPQGPGAAPQGNRVEQDQTALGKGTRGWMETVRQGAQRLVSIFLTDRADPSTFLHESGHAFWELKADLALQDLRPEQQLDPELVRRKAASRADLEAALKWMGVADRAELDQRAQEATAIRSAAAAAKRDLTAAERARVKELAAPFEKWARGFEAYLMEGKAPSLALAGAFRTFKRWLSDVYRVLPSNQLDDSIRQVWDRMLATDDEIAAVAKAIGIVGDALEQATSRAEIAALQEVLRVDEQWWKDERRKVLEETEKEYDAQPAVRAWKFLRKGDAGGDERLAALGDVKLDHATVVAMVGADVAEKRFRGLLQKFKASEGAGGIHPDHLAAVLGAGSGEALVKAMVALPATATERSAWIEQLADRTMEARHPDVLSERARLRDLVEKALHDEPSVVEELHKQWAEDRKKAGKKAGAPIEAIRAAAQIIVSRQLVQQLDPRRYARAEREAFRKRAAALAKGDLEAAALLSQQRLLNFYLHREATRAKEQVDQVQELAGKLVSEKGQERLGKASPIFRDIALRIMQAAGVIDGAPAEAQNAGILDLTQALAEQELEPDFDTAMIEGLFRSPKAFGDLSIAELGEVDAALRQIRRAARNRLTVVVGNQRIALDAVLGDIRNEASRLPKLPAPAEAASQRTFRQGALWTTGQGFLAAMTDPLTTYLDDDYLGPTARRALRDRYYAARGVEHQLLKDVALKVSKAFDVMPAEMKRRRYEVIDRSMLPLIEGQRREGDVDRGWMYMVLANLGNPENLSRLLGGRGWTLDQVKELFRKNGLTTEEAKFIQGLWDLNDQFLWPQLVAVHERVNGTRPRKVEAAPLTLQLADGEITLRGGYWPAMYDPEESKRGQRQQEVSTESELNYETVRASLIKSFTRKRSDNVQDVIRLDDFGLYPGHVLKVIRYIAYEEMVRDVNRIFAGMKTTVEDRLGRPAYDQLERWLHVVASGSPDSIAAAERGLVRGAGLLTNRVVLTAMLFNVKNAAADVATPLLSLFGPKNARVRPDYVLGAVLEGTAGLVAPSSIGRGWWAMRKEALALSPELQIRHDESVHRVREQFESFGAGGKRWRPLAKLGSTVEPGRLIDWVHHHGFMFQHVAEVWGTTVAWEAAYRQALAEKVDQKEAIRRADDVIQKTFPSNLPAEKSHVVRSKGFAGAFLLMHGFFNRTANRVRQTVHPAMVEFGNAEGWWDKAKTPPAIATSGVMVLGIFGVVNVLGSLLEGRGPEQGEDTPEWLKRKFASAPLVIVPLASELAPFVEAQVAQDSVKAKVKFAASERSAPVVSSAIRLFTTLGTIGDEEKEDSKRYWASYEALALALGLPVSQPKRTVPYLADVAAGDEDLELSKLIYGNKPGAADNPATFIGGE